MAVCAGIARIQQHFMYLSLFEFLPAETGHAKSEKGTGSFSTDPLSGCILAGESREIIVGMIAK